MTDKKELNNKNIMNVLKKVFDPEIPINIVDLGLIYNVEISKANIVTITMTLTSIGCPLVASFVEQIKNVVDSNIKDIKRVNVDITFDPPWSPNKISKKGLLELGINIESDKV